MLGLWHTAPHRHRAHSLPHSPALLQLGCRQASADLPAARLAGSNCRQHSWWLLCHGGDPGLCSQATISCLQLGIEIMRLGVLCSQKMIDAPKCLGLHTHLLWHRDVPGLALFGYQLLRQWQTKNIQVDYGHLRKLLMGMTWRHAREIFWSLGKTGRQVLLLQGQQLEIHQATQGVPADLQQCEKVAK